jgi:hypothetical protein
LLRPCPEAGFASVLRCAVPQSHRAFKMPIRITVQLLLRALASI